MSERWPQFNIRRDVEIVEAGGFFCKACCVGKPLDDRSPDPRYCIGCYEILKQEAVLLPPLKRPAWIPKDRAKKQASKKLYRGVYDVSGIMSTVKRKKTKVDIIPSRTQDNKRGPKQRDLPDDFIKELAAAGMGSKAISTRVKEDYGIEVSYRTIQRRMQ